MAAQPLPSRADGVTGQPNPAPLHVAIIMDGNGRWAKARGLPRSAGHKRGADSVRRVVKSSVELGISHLTLFGFSSENWQRPVTEVRDLMGLLRFYLEREVAELGREGVRFRVIGDRARLPNETVKLIEDAERSTAHNARLQLTIALSYCSRQEIISAARALAADCISGKIAPEDIDEEKFAGRLFTKDIPDPDLLIRTSGEQRISNFLLWQLAYTELVFTDTLWPDFGHAELEAAIATYHSRDRRYGSVTS
jgi:undecaprenyl diphosphate synthase